MRELKQDIISECSECGVPGRTWPTPAGQDLCVDCFQTWFNKEEEEPPKWVVQCGCSEIVKSKAIEAQCGCGRVYAVFQIW